MALRRGEIGIYALIAVVVIGYGVYNFIELQLHPLSEDPGVPFYSTASHEVERAATDIIKRENCRDCHTLWAVRNVMQAVPSPPLDGMGSLHSEQWLYDYFSAKDPQSIVPSRLKPKYRMKSYARLPEHERRLLAQYMASLKVKDWYLQEVKKTEYEKLTGHSMVDVGKPSSR